MTLIAGRGNTTATCITRLSFLEVLLVPLLFTETKARTLAGRVAPALPEGRGRAPGPRRQSSATRVRHANLSKRNCRRSSMKVR
jgi:hypothetical protein